MDDQELDKLLNLRFMEDKQRLHYCILCGNYRQNTDESHEINCRQNAGQRTCRHNDLVNAILVRIHNDRDPRRVTQGNGNMQKGTHMSPTSSFS